MKNFKLLLVILFIPIFSNQLFSQADINPDKKCLDISISVGTDFNNTFYNPGVVLIKNKWGISADYYYGTSSFSSNEFYDHITGIEIKRIAFLGKNSYFQIGTGISYLTGEKRVETLLYEEISTYQQGIPVTMLISSGTGYKPECYSSFGVPITARFILGFNKTVAFNIGGYFNINKERNIYSLMVGLSFSIYN